MTDAPKNGRPKPPAERILRRPPGTFRDRDTGEELTREEAFAKMSARRQQALQVRAKREKKT